MPRPNAQEYVVHHRTTAPPVSSAPYPEARGTSLPSLHGDLKLVMVGAGNVKLSVSFREYPKARRNKAQSRGEARRQEKVVPLIAQTGEGKREAVIETAREGIYLFMVEAENGEPASATFTVTFFEKGSRGRTATLGTRTVNERSVLTRILMPDAIVWEDDSAFTAIVRDAESTTKFNTRTGMQWKEYNQ
ncbi:MAG TPA: hypothetical protein VJ604_08065 [Geomonas sp.]|nr:hypothetical protein [Geomonas sp.]